MMRSTVLIVPGLGDSGAEHWQSLWEATDPRFHRVRQRDWELPSLPEWVEALDVAVKGAPTPPLIVAHSLGCALVAHWFGRMRRPVAAALLVAPADVDSPEHTPPEVRCFRPIPLDRLPFPSTVVGSSDDPYVAPARARWFAQRWGSRFVLIEEAGHINTESKLGEWPEGRRLLAALESETST